MTRFRQRLYASLLVLGIGILLFRTIVMLVEGALSAFVPWVSALLVVEFLIDGAAVTAFVRWWITVKEDHIRIPLR
jgi:hypothetical protein